jgi:lipoate-protein ligase B
MQHGYAWRPYTIALQPVGLMGRISAGKSPARVNWQIPRRGFSGASSSAKLLQHEHLHGDANGITSYAVAAEAQEIYRSQLLKWKALSNANAVASDVPRPHLISFESSPIFTLGRRQDDLTAQQTSRLERELAVDLEHRGSPIEESFKPQTAKTNRGGLTTYHGPGQLVLWPVLDMHSPLYPRYDVASYAGHLESTTQQLLAELFGIKTYISRDDPGVWVHTTGSDPPRKIAALGVHHRRYVTALGIALNIDIPVTGPEEINPWARFVPCGLEGKLVTSVEAELSGRRLESDEDRQWDLAALAGRWAEMFDRGLVDVNLRTMDGSAAR